MRKASAALAMMFGASAWGQQPPLEIMGFQLDRALDCAVVYEMDKSPGFNQAAWDCQNDKPIVRMLVPFMDSQARLTIRRDGGAVVAMYLAHAEAGTGFGFEDALTALIYKYGTPEITESTIRNAAGVEFKQTLALWRRGDAGLLLKRHDEYVGRPSLSLTGARARVIAEDAERERIRRNAGNL